MKKYNWFKKFISSMAPTDLYTYCESEKFISTLLYLILLLLILSLSFGGYLGFSTKTAFDKTIADFDNGTLAPVSYIPNEGIVYEGEKPAIIKHFSTPIIIDTRGQMDINELYRIKNYLLIESNSYKIVENNSPIILPIATFQDMGVTPISFLEIKSLLKSISYLSIILFIISMGIMLSIFFLYSGIFVLLLINLVNLFSGMRVKISKLIQFVIYAMTPSLVWKAFFYFMFMQRKMPSDSVISAIDNFLVYIYPVIILSIIFRRVRRQIIK